jgi:hypothetical protein
MLFGNYFLLGMGGGYLLDRPDQIPQRPDRLVVFIDYALGEKRVPDVWVAPLVWGGAMRGEMLCYDVWEVQEEDKLAVFFLRMPLDKDGCLDPVVFAWFDDVFDLEAGPGYYTISV